jgi:SNF2 family DNA or RNA helicase
MTAPLHRKSLEPWIPDSLVYDWWQIEDVRDLCQRGSYLNGNDMGLGKTLEALTTFAIDVKVGRASRAIVVCPVTLKENWADEIDKFTRFGYMVLEGSPAKRRETIDEFHHRFGVPALLIVNYEQLDAHMKELNAIHFDVAIFDEAHYIKNPKAKRTKAAHRLWAKRNYILTGTPMLNQVDELWSLLHKIDPIAYPRFWTFVQRYAVFGGYEGRQIIGVKNERELNRRINEVMVRRLAKDTLGLDEPRIIPRIVGLHPEQKKLYDEVVDDMRLTLPDEPQPMDIENALTKFLRLKQICGTTATLLGLDKDYSFKLDLAIEDDRLLVDEGEKIIVFTQFRGVLDAYVQRARREFGPKFPIFTLSGATPPDQRVPTVNEWSAVEGPAIIVCMLQVANIGLNMQASHEISFLDKLFVPKLNEQAIGRSLRRGQKYPVRVREYRVKGTVETRIEAILKTKTGLFKSVVDAADYKKLLYKLLKDDDAA